MGLFDSLKNSAADNLGNVLGGNFNLGSIGDLPAVIGEHFNADQLGEINRSLATI
ncbi:MAG: flagellar M-ring protein FliF [Bifidobacterium catenulatum]|uniref:flagellar M-ring protein FliF n=1 Tax=Bifidobacterium breve TaxID=1685 RepID=UPI000D0E7127|nr:flagellar M-ring protein FliF [Bifidobacterium breve]